jgi:hypothetical protein
MATAMTIRSSWPGGPGGPGGPEAAERTRDDEALIDRAQSDQGPAQEVIGEMASLLRNPRGDLVLGGSVLSAITVATALEAAFSHPAMRLGIGGILSVILLGSLIGCWLRAVALLLLAGRPLLDQLNDHRWRTGGPVDPRVKWLTLPTIEDSAAEWNWARVNLLLGAARIRRERIHLADTWTFITAALFLVWTAAIFLGL